MFGAITLAYTLVSGLLGVAYNDALQFFLVVAGNGIFGWLLLAQAGGMAHAWDQIVALRGRDFLNPSPMTGNIGAISLAALCVQGLFFVFHTDGP